MAKIDYMIVEDEKLAKFLGDHLTRRAKEIIGIKQPWIGKNRGKVLIPRAQYPHVVQLYMVFGIDIPEGQLLDAQIREN